MILDENLLVVNYKYRDYIISLYRFTEHGCSVTVYGDLGLSNTPIAATCIGEALAAAMQLTDSWIDERKAEEMRHGTNN
ncbi:MAG: hypothetical protein HC893_00075 [Chloroflexaceae bacterium]|nr:hypothetical protein [Chloroflexaceae bacterium]